MKVLFTMILGTFLFLAGCTKQESMKEATEPVAKDKQALQEEMLKKRIKWGMSVEDVKKNEILELLTENDELLSYDGKLYDYNASVAYSFEDNKLNTVIKTIYKTPLNNLHYSEEEEMQALETVKNELIEQYGEPNGKTPENEKDYIIYSWKNIPNTEISLYYNFDTLSVNYIAKEGAIQKFTAIIRNPLHPPRNQDKEEDSSGEKEYQITNDEEEQIYNLVQQLYDYEKKQDFESISKIVVSQGSDEENHTLSRYDEIIYNNMIIESYEVKDIP